MYAAGKNAGPADALSRGFWMFFRNYLLRLGFISGFDGFVISLSKGVGTFFEIRKIVRIAQVS